MLNSLETKSVAKSIIRNMEMNGSLESQPARLKQKEETQQEEEEVEDDEEEEKEEIMEARKGIKTFFFKVSSNIKMSRFI